MLVIISDLHLTDESTACNVHGTAFGHLGDAIRSAAREKNASEVHIILLGDIVDLVRTDYWLRNGIPMEKRPWGGKLNPSTAMNEDEETIRLQFEAILGDILACDAVRSGLIPMLNNLPRGRNGKPPKVTYVIGNHDRVLHNFPSLQQMFRDLLPEIDLSFATKVELPEYGVLARHGHEYDEICHGWWFSNNVMRRDRTLDRFSPEAYKVMAIGEALTAELMSGLIYHTACEFPEETRTEEQRNFLRNLVNVNNLRPMLDVFKWITWYTRDGYSVYQKALFQALKKSLDSFLDCKLAKKWDDMEFDLLLSGDITDKLEKLRLVLKIGGAFEVLRDIVSNWISRTGPSMTPEEGDELTEGARTEWDDNGGTIDSRYQYVVYGHTHEALHRCFSARPDGTIRMYINTGTYLPLIQQTDDGKGFYSAHQMTMAFFYKRDEDESQRADFGPTVDIWNGIRRKMYTQDRPFGDTHPV